jgi:hypothetical protein
MNANEIYFPEAAPLYRGAGWSTAVPLPYKRKATPPAGYTGNLPKLPSDEDYTNWAKIYPNGNIALVVPDGWLGFDVDTYGEKDGWTQWFEFWDSLGIDASEMDHTWISSARNPVKSGIRWFRVPRGYDWPSQLASNIEIIRPGHRYAVVWPSIHPDGTRYEWYAPGELTEPSERIPGPNEPVQLPTKAVNVLNLGIKKAHQPYSQLGWAETEDWLQDRPNEVVCQAMALEVEAAKKAIIPASVHDPMVKKTQSLIHLASEGCSGVVEALNEVYAHFKAVSDRRGDRGDYQGEWMRAVIGAVSKSTIKGESCWCPGMNSNVTLNKKTGEITEADEVSETPAEETPKRVSGWSLESIDDLLEDDYEPLMPTMMTCTNGVNLIYPGRSHSLAGESGSGKTMIALAAAAQALLDGKRVLILDFESDPHTVIRERLMETFRVPVGVIRNQVGYKRPECRPVPGTEDHKDFRALVAEGWDLVIIDGVTNSIAMWGGSGRSEDDVSVWRNEFLMPFELVESAVLMIDHVTKNAETRGKYAIGSQGKKGILTGALYLVENVHAFGRGMKGVAQLTLAKDRNGQIERYKNTKTGVIARFVMDSTDETNVRFHFDNGPGDMAPIAFGSVELSDDQKKEIMEQFIKNNPGATTKEVLACVPGNENKKSQLLAQLKKEERVYGEPQGKGKPTLHFPVEA